MKMIKFTGVFVAALLLSPRIFAQTGVKEQLVVPLSDPGKPYKIEVGLISGSITVNSYEGKDIVIDIQSEARKRKEESEAPNGMKRLSNGQNVEVVADEKDNSVNIHTGVPMKQVNLTIKIPNGATRVKLSTINSGNITASDIGGDLEITNVNGGIKLSNVWGSVVANTVNGAVVVNLKSVDGKAPMAFTTLNGNVDVTFPASLKGNVKLRSDRGDVFSDFDVVTDKTQPKATKTAKDGMYKVSIEDWIYGKVNGGGPEILMKNMNGNIYIRKAK